MKNITLGSTGITTPQNAFGALPVQRVDMATAVKLLRGAYDGGMTFFDTARAYTDSEEKLGEAFDGMRDKVYISSKTQAKTPEKFWRRPLEICVRIIWISISSTVFSNAISRGMEPECMRRCWRRRLRVR